MRLLEMESPGHTHVKGIEVMTKMRIAAADGTRDGHASAVSWAIAGQRSPRSAGACGERIVRGDRRVQLVAVLDLASQGVARDVGQAAVAKSGNVEILGNAGGPSPDGGHHQLPRDFHNS